MGSSNESMAEITPAGSRRTTEEAHGFHAPAVAATGRGVAGLLGKEKRDNKSNTTKRKNSPMVRKNTPAHMEMGRTRSQTTNKPHPQRRDGIERNAVAGEQHKIGVPQDQKTQKGTPPKCRGAEASRNVPRNTTSRTGWKGPRIGNTGKKTKPASYGPRNYGNER